MKKKLLFILTLVLFIPFNVKATCISVPITVDVCYDDCSFNNLEDAYDYIYDNYCSSYNTDVTINIGEGTYTINDSLYLGEFRNVKIKGEGIDKTIIKYNYCYGIFFGYNSSLKLSNFTLKSGTGTNKEYAMVLYNNEIVNLDNIKVDSKSNYGIILQSNYNLVNINNVDVKNTYEAGIYRNECNINYENSIEPKAEATIIYPYYNEDSAYYNGVVVITNSDLTGNGCGYVEGDNYCYTVPMQEPLSNMAEIQEYSVQTTTSLISDYDYTSRIENTKLSCSAAYNNYDDYTPRIYIPANNEWEIDPEYDENVIEESDGQVVIEIEKSREISLKSNNLLELDDIFNKIDTYGTKNINIQDENIIKIENDKIIPLKVGSTSAVITAGNATFILNLRVTDTKNPTTYTTGHYIIGLLVILLFTSTIFKKKILKSK